MNENEDDHRNEANLVQNERNNDDTINNSTDVMCRICQVEH